MQVGDLSGSNRILGNRVLLPSSMPSFFFTSPWNLYQSIKKFDVCERTLHLVIAAPVAIEGGEHFIW
jgi:hypothetical protein